MQAKHHTPTNNNSKAAAATTTWPTQPNGHPSWTVEQVVAKFIESKSSNGCGQLYLRDLRSRLGRFANHFGNRPIDSLRTADVAGFVGGLNASPRAQWNHKNCIARLYRYAQGHGYVAEDPNPANGVHLPRPKRVRVEPGILTPADMRRLLAAAEAKMPAAVPYLLLGGFCRLRPVEICGLRWEDLRLEKTQEGGSRVVCVSSKSRLRRAVPIPENIVDWLARKKKKPSGLVLSDNVSIRTMLAKLCKMTGLEWPRNGLRHSFIAYRLALTTNVPLVASECGRDIQTLHRWFIGLATSKAAQDWFSIKPSDQNHQGREKQAKD